MSTSDALTRRSFLARTSQASAALAAGGAATARAATPWPPPIVVFSKLYQELQLGYDRAAEITAAVCSGGRLTA